MLITTLVVSLLVCCGLHVSAKEVKVIHEYKNIKRRLYKTMAAIWYNKTPNLQPTANQERNDQCGNQHYSRELLMMGRVVPETYRDCKNYNKIISGV